MSSFYFEIVGETLEEKRKYFIDEYFLPLAKDTLNDDVKCLVFAVAQYYNDEADDAVHAKFFKSKDFYSTWDNLFKYDDCGDMVYGKRYLDDNGEMIEVFKDFCIESSQDFSYKESYSPYAIAELKDGLIKIRVIAKTFRLLK